MALYTIIRVYKVPAKNRIQATDRMMEALELHTEKDYHANDYIREPGEKPGQGISVKLKSSESWLTLFLRQLFGK